MEANDERPPAPDGFGRIVLCVDSSKASGCAGAFARLLAGRACEVTIAAVAPDPKVLAVHAALPGLDLGIARSGLLEEAQHAIAEASAAFADTAVVVRSRVIELAKETGDVASALIREAGRAGTDLIVIGVRQHHGLVRWFDPSVLDRLGRLSPCAMIVEPAECERAGNVGLRRILFGVDGSATSLAALEIGARLAAPGACLRAVYVVDRAMHEAGSAPKTLVEDAFIKEGERAISTAIERLEGLQVAPRAQISADLIDTGISGDDIASTLLREAKRWNADLIVMGTHGRRGGPRSYFGSVPNRVASVATIRLLLVREQHREAAPG